MLRSVIFLLLLALCSCSSNQQKQQAPSAPPAITPLPTTSRDTLVVRSKAAVCYSADSLQIEQAKKTDSDAFYVAADDWLYYMSVARNRLDSMGAKIISARNETMFCFIKKDRSSFFVRRDSIGLWGIYLFDGIHNPYQADITDIQSEYARYYK